MTDEGDIPKAFARIFGTAEGQLVVADLERESGLRGAVFPAGNLDGAALVVRAGQKDGQRLLMIYILGQISEGEDILRRETPGEKPRDQETEVIRP